MRIHISLAQAAPVVCSILCLCGTLAAQPAAPASTAIPDVTRALSMLDDGLRDKNPDTRKQAIQSVGLTGPREPFLTLVGIGIQDKDLEVRLAAIATLMDLKNAQTVPTLKKLLNDDIPEVAFAAAKALWLLGDPAGRDALVAVLSGETKASSGFITKQKREALRMLHTPRTLLLFSVRVGAAFAPVPGLGTGVSSLEGILTNPDTSGRAATALLLGPDKDPAVIAALHDALADKDWSVRAAAVHAIALRDDPKLEPDLLPLFDDKKEAVRLRAAAGYLRLDWIRLNPPPPPPAPKPPAAKKATKKAVTKTAPATPANAAAPVSK